MLWGVDVVPEWYEDWSRASCGAETRRCGGGDQACSAQAAKDGYVRISNYSFCPKDRVEHEPGVAGYAAIGVTLFAALAAGFMWSRRSRRRPPAA